MIAILLTSFTCFQQGSVDPTVVNWIKVTAHPLNTVVAESGFADLQPFKNMIGNARVVSMGEATHGTREIFQMKHRMLEFLVKEMGFTTIGVEASFVECLRVNDFVLNGKGTAASALNNTHYFVCGTEEMMALVAWMRRYNLDPSTKRKVSFYGFDIYRPVPSVSRTLDFLREADPKLAAPFEGLLETLPKEITEKELLESSDDVWRANRKSLKALVAVFDSKKSVLIRSLGEDGYEDAKRCAVVSQQAFEFYNSYRNSPSWFISQQNSSASRLYWGEFDQSASFLRNLVPSLPVDVARDVTELLGRVGLFIGFTLDYKTKYTAAQRSHMKELSRRILAASDRILEVAPNKMIATKALQDLEALFPFMEKYAVRESNVLSPFICRDRQMTENALWILGREGRGSRMMTWAHNVHVEKSRGPVTFGGGLTAKLKEQHFVVGFAVNRGSLQSVTFAGSAEAVFGTGLKGFYFGPSPKGSLDDTLALSGIANFYLDVRDAKDSVVETWLDSPIPSRSVGARFDPRVAAPGFLHNLAPRKSFDAIIYLHDTTRAHPAPWTRERFKITNLTPVNPPPPSGD